MRFRDRSDAGRQLAVRLAEELRGSDQEVARSDLVVLALPRGGVPVGYEVAVGLTAPLDVILVRKIGLPVQPELAMGAIGEDGVRVVNDEVVRAARVSAAVFAEVEARERRELERRAARFRALRPRVPLAGRTGLIVDDGIATGSTVRAAAEVARALGAARVMVATPVAPESTVARLRHADEVDAVFVLETPPIFRAIGESYDDFTQVAEEQVVELLRGTVTP
jgi:putative phosphoribosyl transferase